MSNKKKISNNLPWKPVLLDEAFINKGVENLIGIEELTDYSIVEGNIVPSTNQNVEKEDEYEVEEDVLEENETQKPKNIKLKKRKKNKIKLKNPKIVPSTNQKVEKEDEYEVEEDEDLVEENEDIVEENETQKPKNIKLKKRKKNKIKLKKPKIVEENEAEEENEGPKAKKAKTEIFDSDEIIEGMEAWCSYDLPKPILKALSVQGFTQPTPIQERTLPSAIFGRKDILGAAETGSGKTLAFGLPILAGILKNQNNQINNQSRLYALVLTPTRELAIQVGRHITAAARFTSIQVAVLVGGLATERQQRLLKRRPEIVVATPGRLWDLLQDGEPHLSEGVSTLDYLAIDETDRMLERGHFRELKQLLTRLNAEPELIKDRQNFVFSATLTMTHAPVRRKAQITSEEKLDDVVKAVGMTEPKIVDITSATRTASALTESRIQCTIDEKDLYLYYFITRHTGRTLVFCNSIGCVQRLTNLLNILECRPYPLHASMAQRQRLKNLERFQENPNGLLLATDVAARGLDIPGVQYVIHYQVPKTAESYVHRSGRTARANADGLTLILVEPGEVAQYLRLWKTLGRSIQTSTDFPIDMNWLGAVKKRVNLARKLDKVDWNCRRANADRGWVEKAKREMDIILDDDETPQRASDKTCTQLKHQVNMLRKQLSALIGKPLVARGKILQGTQDALILAKEAGQKKRKKPKFPQ